MSIPVPLEDLATAVRQRTFGYLVTVGADHRAKVLALVPDVVTPASPDAATELHFRVGTGGTAANAVRRPEVTVVFPPVDDDGFSLVVDGRAEVHEGRLRLHPTWAVLHRPAP